MALGDKTTTLSIKSKGWQSIAYHLPEDEQSDAVKWPLAYLLGERELNYDPTNYWMFNDAAMTRLIERSGFNIVGKMMRSNNPEGIGLPNHMEKGVRGFYLLSSTHFVPT